MTRSLKSKCRVLVNAQGVYACWPKAKPSVPAGWSDGGFSGSAEACSQWVTERWLSRWLESAPSVDSPETVVVANSCTLDKTSYTPAISTPYPNPNAEHRLIFFPHAGSGVAYYHFLGKAFSDTSIEVCLVAYPGREMRLREEPVCSMDALIRLLHGEMKAFLSERPFSLMGHSMGALVAFEFARVLQTYGAEQPEHLICTGHKAPCLPPEQLDLENLDDASFLDVVGRRYGAIPSELVDTPEMIELLLPSMRADFKLLAAYTFQQGDRLHCPLTLINGDADPWVSEKVLAPWGRHAPLTEKYWISGGHFFVGEQVNQVLKLVKKVINKNRNVQ